MTADHSEAATGGVLLKKVFLKISQISQENTCVDDYSKETPIQEIPCEICKFFKNKYFEKHLRTTASSHYALS